jgi:hypothetical protein
MPEASWTLCIGGRETQGQVEVHVVVIPSEDRNRLSLLDWCKTGQRSARLWRASWRQANASSRLTRF